MRFEPYACVRIVALPRDPRCVTIYDGGGGPRVGDVATIVEVYASPDGYELECCDAEGMTLWQASFGPEDVELALAP